MPNPLSRHVDTTEVALRKVRKARANLILDEVFFGPLAFKLILKPDPTARKMWTDGVYIGFNPAWVTEAPLDEIISRICEITMHNADGHSWRMEGRDPHDWNIAADYSLWGILKNAKFALPNDVYYSADYNGLSPEMIYTKIHKPPPPPEEASEPEPDQEESESEDEERGEENPPDDDEEDEGEDEGNGDESDEPSDEGGDGDETEDQPQRDPGSDGEVRPVPMEVDPGELEADWQMAVLEAYAQAKAAGHAPAGLERLVEKIINPVIPWQETLRKIVQQIIAKADYSWRRPSRRYISQGFYLPEVRSERMPAGVILWDTSGSRDDEQSRAECAAECASIIDECRPEKLYVMYVDTEVNRVDVFEPGDPIEFHPMGGGGTDFISAFEHIEKEGWEPAFFIGITDLYATFPAKAPEGYPVIWCATTNAVAPWGEVLRLNQGK